MTTRIACFDLGVIGAVVEARIDGPKKDRRANYKRHETWNVTRIEEEDRYLWFMRQVGPIVSRADAVLYELVQFNRGRSSIPGFRAILLAVSGVYERPCLGVNVATLKSFAGLRKVPKGKSKQYMAISMAENYFSFWDTLTNGGREGDDNVVDAAMLCHWAAANLEVG